jgi:ATP-grasp domain, R2K clade family 3
MLFLFPSDYFNFKLVDEMYRSERQSLQKAGFVTATMSIDSLDPRSPKVHPAITPQIDVTNPAEIRMVIAEMHKFRGTIEGGICVRRVEDFLPETERRYFIINGKSFAADRAAPIPNIVTECARRIDSKFFSIDIIERRDGVLRVVEIGDGQVSGLVGWTPERFAEIWVDRIDSID